MMASKMGGTTVIVGAGIAGLSTAKTLRQLGSTERIVWLGGEPGLPYKRTQLSKNLYRPLDRGEFAMIGSDELISLDIEYLSPVRVEKIDSVKKKIFYRQSPADPKSSSEMLAYSSLVLALGSIPLVDPGYYFEEDFLNLQRTLDGTSRQVRVFGSGVLGVELAEQITRRGHKVTITCRGRYPMARELPNPLGNRLLGLLADHGVDISFGVTSPNLDPDSLVLSALGVQPQTLLAQSSGLHVGAGIKVNSFLETSVEHVYAVGDCAEHEDGSISHLWHQAEEQGEYAAKRIWGESTPFTPQIFRTKAEFFGQRVFSSGIIHQSPEVDKGDVFEMWSNAGLDFWARFRNERLIGLSFIGDWPKDFGKWALQGVREGWTREGVKKSL